MLNDDSILVHSPDLSGASVLSDGLVIQLNDKLHTLNETAREIFELCNGSRSVGAVVKELRERYPDGTDVSEYVRNFITQLHDAGLLTDKQ